MARPELGTKRRCKCGAIKYYDLNRTQIDCPRCGVPLEPSARPAREAESGEAKARAADAPATASEAQTADPEIAAAKIDSGGEKLEDIEDNELDSTLEDEDDDTLFLDDEEDGNTDIPVNVKIDDEDRES